MTDWRLIPFLSAEGRVQMAIDAWLLNQHRQGKHPPTLRFYEWQPAAISLGYHQRRYPKEWHDLTWAGRKVDIVRRPSGGRAVLHQGDLTYAVITSGLTGTVIQVYESVCQFLIEGWQTLGTSLNYGGAGRGYIHQANCFALATGSDLVDREGNKFIGSAQLRRGQALLQHGSMLLQQDPRLFERVFIAPAPAHPLLRADLSREKIINVLTESASRCFGVNLIPQALSEEEWHSIDHHKNL